MHSEIGREYGQCVGSHTLDKAERDSDLALLILFCRLQANRTSGSFDRSLPSLVFALLLHIW